MGWVQPLMSPVLGARVGYNPWHPAFEAWVSVLNTLSRTVSGPALLDAIVALVHPAVPHPN